MLQLDLYFALHCLKQAFWSLIIGILFFYRIKMIAAHEDQLAAVTSYCKQEMKLLLSAKAGQKVSRVLHRTMVGRVLHKMKDNGRQGATYTEGC